MDNQTYRTLEGSLAFYHPTGNGNGSAVRFELRPARRGREGCIFAEIAPQKTRAVRDPGQKRPATFDWQARIVVKLGLSDLCAMMSVLEGREDSAGGERGLFHQSADATTVIGFRRVTEPLAGYVFEVSRKMRTQNAPDPVRLRIVLGENEACALRHVLAGSFFHLCFYWRSQEVAPLEPEPDPEEEVDAEDAPF